MHRRSTLAVVLATVVLVSGCSALQDASPTSTPPEKLVVAGVGDYPHDIQVSNARDQDVSLTIFVEHGETLYRADHTIAADSDSVVGGFTVESLPEDSRLVTVRARDDRGNSTSVEVSLSDCLGDVVIIIGSDGSLDSTYSIC